MEQKPEPMKTDEDQSSNSSQETSVNDIQEILYSIKLGDLNYDESLKLAEKYKAEGNEFFKQNKFLEALEKYTQAIDLKVETKNNAIYYSNRSFVNLNLENYGSAILDANYALKIDSEFYKAYYRRAGAYFSLGKFAEALKDYLFLKTKITNDSTLDEKIAKTRKAKKKKEFFLAYSSEGRGKEIVTIEKILKNLKPSNTYKGPIFPNDGKIDKNWVMDVIEHLKDPNNTKKKEEKYIDQYYLLQMLLKVKQMFLEQKEALVDVDIPNDKEFTVVGDIHGQFYDLLHIFEINGYPSEENPYLFNGDYVDRGVFSIECLTTLLSFKILYPKHLYLTRGNHESVNLNLMYGFKKEVEDKYNTTTYECFTDWFKTLPLGHILNKEVLVVHGGLFSKDGVTIDEIKKIDRFREIPESGIMSELMWSDPCKQKGRIPSKRGVGMSFGPDVAERFLNENNLKLLVRSHEVKMEGYEVEPEGKVITLFSAPNYCDQMGNKGAIIRFKGGEMKPKFIQFTASPHPDISIKKYMFNFF